MLVIVRWLFAVLTLPGTVLGLVPLFLVWFSDRLGASVELVSISSPAFWIGLIPAGFWLGLWTMSLFFRLGDGTPAPWDPPNRFVVVGPYRHVRNPMILGVLLMLLGQALLLQSWFIAGWMLFFFAGNCIYFPLVEEPGLVRRFGRDYEIYRQHVPRWIPRFSPWHG